MRGGKVYLSMGDMVGAVAVGDKVSFSVYADATGLGAMECKKDDGSGVQPTINKPEALKPGGAAAGPATGRASVAGGAVHTGQLTTWSGTMGWITPIGAMSHPLFKGKIYFTGREFIGNKAALSEGSILSFSLYTDSQGLGAEKCKLADEAGGPTDEPTIMRPKTKASSVVADGDSMVLKAKPKMSADSGSASVLKAKPKMAASKLGSLPGGAITIPGHLSPALAERLVAWMWDRGG